MIKLISLYLWLIEIARKRCLRKRRIINILIRLSREFKYKLEILSKIRDNLLIFIKMDIKMRMLHSVLLLSIILSVKCVKLMRSSINQPGLIIFLLKKYISNPYKYSYLCNRTKRYKNVNLLTEQCYHAHFYKSLKLSKV